MIYFDQFAYNTNKNTRTLVPVTVAALLQQPRQAVPPLVAAKGDGPCRPIYIIAPVKEGRKR